MLLDDRLNSKESRWVMNAWKSSVFDDGDLYMDEKKRMVNGPSFL